MIKSNYILKSSAIFTGLNVTTISGYVAIADNQIIYVGDASGLKELVCKDTVKIDCGDGLIMPSFNDAHLHFYFSALYMSDKVENCGDCQSEEECAQRLLPLAERTPKNDWLIGTMWYYPTWNNKKLPTKRSLDKLFPDRPVCMISGELHTVWLNSEGLIKLGITDESEPEEGGVYFRFPNGELTGTIGEASATLIMRKVLHFEIKDENKFYLDFIHLLNSRGITSVSDMSLTATPGGDFVRDDIYTRLLNQDKLTLRINMFPTLTLDLKRPKQLIKKFKGNILSCRGCKQFYDGVSSCHTAYLKDNYSNPYFEGDHGRTTVPHAQMRSLVLNAVKNDVSVRVHTIGDQAIHEMLNFYEEATQLYGNKPNLHHTLEHLENLQQGDISRFNQLNVIASVQPLHVLYDTTAVESDLGLERCKLMWPFKSFLDSNAKIAFGTDSPVVDCNPLKGLYEAVTRQSAETGKPQGGWQPQEKITISQAIKAYTFGSATAVGCEEILGTLQKGKLADICVLDRNILKGVENILNANVEMTIMDGKIVYSANNIVIKC